jgi:hypothetical protein
VLTEDTDPRGVGLHSHDTNVKGTGLHSRKIRILGIWFTLRRYGFQRFWIALTEDMDARDVVLRSQKIRMIKVLGCAHRRYG